MLVIYDHKSSWFYWTNAIPNFGKHKFSLVCRTDLDKDFYRLEYSDTLYWNMFIGLVH